MNKMQMAHDYALEMLKETLPTGSLYGDDANRVAMSMVELAWALADAMQAEADERNKVEAEQKRKEVREILNDANTFIEREGQHFDDVEWQPDWSQAPDDLVKYFAVDEDGRGGWYINKPDLCFAYWNWSGWGERARIYEDADNFGYQGNWKNSLRKRPQ